ncbi:MAG: alpha/beta hydrolase [Bacteroidales bacterium]|nr:alpha/beta hydrolase [Bacteroidales bacterium]
MNTRNIKTQLSFSPAVMLLLIMLITNCKMSHSQNSLNPYRDILPLKTMKDMQYPFEVKYLDLRDNINLAYIDEGTGDQTILFIHGLGSYLKAWKKNIEGLKSQYRCIAIDLPGYGKSSKLANSGKMSFYAEVVKDFIDKLNLENVVLAGHSMGGQIAMMAAVNYPHTIQKIILVDPAGFEEFTEGQKQWFREVMTVDGVMNTTVEQIQTNLAYNFYNVPDDAEFMTTDRIAIRSADDFEAYCYAVVNSVKGMVDETMIDILGQISQPTLILFGENDNLIPNRFLNPGRTIDIAFIGDEKIPNSKLITIPRAGHFLQFEKPDEFKRAVVEFLNE